MKPYMYKPYIKVTNKVVKGTEELFSSADRLLIHQKHDMTCLNKMCLCEIRGTECELSYFLASINVTLDWSDLDVGLK